MSGDLPVVRMLYELEGEDEQDLATNLSTFPELFGSACPIAYVHLLYCTNNVWAYVRISPLGRSHLLCFPPNCEINSTYPDRPLVDL